MKPLDLTGSKILFEILISTILIIYLLNQEPSEEKTASIPQAYIKQRRRLTMNSQWKCVETGI